LDSQKKAIETMPLHSGKMTCSKGGKQTARSLSSSHSQICNQMLDQDDFWLNQPKVINLIAFKVIVQLYESMT
jgi:hypothetical protein